MSPESKRLCTLFRKQWTPRVLYLKLCVNNVRGRSARHAQEGLTAEKKLCKRVENWLQRKPHFTDCPVEFDCALHNIWTVSASQLFTYTTGTPQFIQTHSNLKGDGVVLFLLVCTELWSSVHSYEKRHIFTFVEKTERCKLRLARINHSINKLVFPKWAKQTWNRARSRI